MHLKVKSVVVHVDEKSRKRSQLGMLLAPQCENREHEVNFTDTSVFVQQACAYNVYTP